MCKENGTKFPETKWKEDTSQSKVFLKQLNNRKAIIWPSEDLQQASADNRLIEVSQVKGVQNPSLGDLCKVVP